MAFYSARGLSAKPLPSVVLFMGYLLAFCLLAACVAYWAMQLMAPPATVAASGVVADKTASLDLTGAGSLFGNPSASKAGPVAAQPPVSVQILGLMAVSSGVRASAILAVDSRPAQAFAVGDSLGNDTNLVEIRTSSVVLEQRGTRSTVQAAARPTLAELSKQQSSAIKSPLPSGTVSSRIKSPIGVSNSAGYIPPPPAPAAPISPPIMQPAQSIQPATPMQPSAPIQGSAPPLGQNPYDAALANRPK
jgi:general secretion pathway protein C